MYCTCIFVAKQIIPQSWGTSNGTFVADKVGDIEISFVEYSTSTKVCLQLEFVEYSPGDPAPMYDLIVIDKQTMHNLEAVLDFKMKTIQIYKILLGMRNIANLQLKPSITRALRQNTCLAQPISTLSATKCVVEIMDAKYEKADFLAIVRENRSHLEASDREKLLSVPLKFELLFDGTLGDWILAPVSFELKEDMKL
jgi:hypothetical protein